MDDLEDMILQIEFLPWGREFNQIVYNIVPFDLIAFK